MNIKSKRTTWFLHCRKKPGIKYKRYPVNWEEIFAHNTLANKDKYPRYIKHKTQQQKTSN